MKENILNILRFLLLAMPLITHLAIIGYTLTYKEKVKWKDIMITSLIACICYFVI